MFKIKKNRLEIFSKITSFLQKLKKNFLHIFINVVIISKFKTCHRISHIFNLNLIVFKMLLNVKRNC